jgi:CheY-like chemotaxis protein
MILLDINLPQMNGIELLQQLSQNPAFASIPVILLISLPEDQERLHKILKSNGIEVFGYMMKPIKADRLIETLAIVEQYWETQI